MPTIMIAENVRFRTSMMSLAAGVVALLAAGACSGEASAPDRAATGDTSGPGLLLETNGIAPFDEGMEERHVGFGTPVEDALTNLAEFIGEADRNGSSPDCGAGPVTYFTFGPVTLNMLEEEFVGWWLRAPTGDGPWMGINGITVGATRSELEEAFSSLTITESTLGTEFSAGEVGGLLSSTDQAATVTDLWAGVACFAR